MTKQKQDGQHSFLFWLTVPAILLWLSVGYLIGFIKDKPVWLAQSGKDVSTPYFTEYAPINGGLDQAFISFWFDDAWLSQYINAYPILEKYDYKAALAVPTNAIGTPNYMNWAQVKKLAAEGWEINNHSKQHDCEMDTWDKDKVTEELRNSKLTLWKHQLPSDIFVTPCGVDSKIMQEVVMKNFIAYRTVDPGYNDPENVNFENLMVRNIDKDVSIDEVKEWVDYAKENKKWAILVYHRVGDLAKQIDDDTFNTSIQEIEEIAKYINEQKIEVVLPSQILSENIK